MNYLRKSIWILLFVISFCQACNQANVERQSIDQAYNSLKENEARILLKINGKEFYSPKSLFKGETRILSSILSTTLVDQFGGRTMLSLGGDDWYKQSPIQKNLKADDQGGASVKIGKIIDQEKMIGEGYLMAEGVITAVTFSKEKMVFKIKGKVGKYSDFQKPDKYVPVEGLIVYKSPKINYENITEEEVFHFSDNK